MYYGDIIILPYKLTSMRHLVITDAFLKRRKSMEIPTVTPLSLDVAVSPQLHKQLRDRIISCELAPGQRISETEIATTYEVSRQPVREAFIKLAEEQLVHIRPQRGTYITRISIPSALAARFVREAVEADLVRRVCKLASDEMITSLYEQLEQQRKAAQALDLPELMRLDEVFHKSLAHNAATPEVNTFLESLNVQVSRVRNISAGRFSPTKVIEHHQAIVDAIRDRKASAADKAMRTHLREIKKDLPHVVETYPEYFEGLEALKQL